MSAHKELDSFDDREIRDIASQIMVGVVHLTFCTGETFSV